MGLGKTHRLTARVMQFTTSMVMGGAAELLAYGTAVVIDEEGASD